LANHSLLYQGNWIGRRKLCEEDQQVRERLKSMTSMKRQKVDLHKWAARRLRILKQLLASSRGSAGDEL
jgi:hypothetical protein